MTCITVYNSPLGDITLASRDNALTGVWFDGQKHFGCAPDDDVRRESSPVIQETILWLDDYFAGKVPQTYPAMHAGGSDFFLRVIKALRDIPYGELVTYGQLANKLGVNSAQAVGGAVGRNPISILIPCHRVIGAKGALTGYAGGVEKKQALLMLEGHDICQDGRVRL